MKMTKLIIGATLLIILTILITEATLLTISIILIVGATLLQGGAQPGVNDDEGGGEEERSH